MRKATIVQLTNTEGVHGDGRQLSTFKSKHILRLNNAQRTSQDSGCVTRTCLHNIKDHTFVVFPSFSLYHAFFLCVDYVRPYRRRCPLPSGHCYRRLQHRRCRRALRRPRAFRPHPSDVRPTLLRSNQPALRCSCTRFDVPPHHSVCCVLPRRLDVCRLGIHGSASCVRVSYADPRFDLSTTVPM